MSTDTSRAADTRLPSIPAGAHIGHAHLHVGDIERSLRFYRDILGFDLVQQIGIELAWDRPRDQWPRDARGNLTLTIGKAFDLRVLVAEADASGIQNAQ